MWRLAGWRTVPVWGKRKDILSCWEKIWSLPSCPVFGSFYHGVCGKGQAGLRLLCWFCVTFHQPGLETEAANTPLHTDQRSQPVGLLGRKTMPGMTVALRRPRRSTGLVQRFLLEVHPHCVTLAFLGQLQNPIPCLGLFLPLDIYVKGHRAMHLQRTSSSHLSTGF